MSLRLRPGERLLAVYAAKGDNVKAGSPLAEILDGEGWVRLLELKSQKRARLELTSKEDRLARLEDELKTQLRLWKDIEPNSADWRVRTLRDKRDELKEQVELLRLQVADPASAADTNRSLALALDAEAKKLEMQLASPLVVAPFDGRVIYLAPDPARLGTGEIVLEVWDTSVLIRAEVFQQQLKYIAKGCRAEVLLDFSDEKTVSATVEDVESRPEMQAGEAYPTFGVELILDAAAGPFKPGMRVSVHIHPQKPKAD
ncbi:MAG: efflux RND transporter periplasmic adaptor subunit [Verrucomicrobiia bacterium]